MTAHPIRPQSLVGVFPHPDDEAYAAAGLMSRAARSGVKVQLICLTDGAAGPNRGKGDGADPDRGGTRRRELADSCLIMGIAPPHILGLPDGQLDQQEAAPIIAGLTRAFGSHDPDWVVTLGRDGVYGHRDHLACCALTGAAFAAGVCRDGARLLHCAFPRGLFEPLADQLRRYRRGALFATQAQMPPGVPRDEADLIVDLTGFGPIKRRAIRAHASQLPDGDEDRFLMPGLVSALLAEEWFTLAAGPPLGPPDAWPFGAGS